MEPTKIISETPTPPSTEPSNATLSLEKGVLAKSSRRDWQGTSDQPLHVWAHSPERAWMAQCTDPLTLFTLALAIITLILVIFAHQDAKEAVEAMHSTNENIIATEDRIHNDAKRAQREINDQIIEAQKRTNEATIYAQREINNKLVDTQVGTTRELIAAQVATALHPTVVLDTQDDFIANENNIVVRNVGVGPAFNTFTTPIVIGRTTIKLFHRTSLGAGETQDIDGRKEIDGHLILLTKPMDKPPWKQGTPQVSIATELLLATSVCIQYQNANGESYETRQILSQPSPKNLGIEFICHRKTSTPCTEAIEMASPSKR